MLTDKGKRYICFCFGNAAGCCVKTGLSWFYKVGGMNYNETGGTAQIVSRLASGLVESLTMTSPARGIFTKADLDAANTQAVTLEDAKAITGHDEPTEVQWCFPGCAVLPDRMECEFYGCYWWNGACHANPPAAGELNNQADCSRYKYFWYGVPPVCKASDQLNLCYFLDACGGPAGIKIVDVFVVIDAYLFDTPPAGYTFVPTIAKVFGVIDYYLGFNGDAATGCKYY